MSDYKRLEISEVIYECVRRTEPQDMNRESVELMLDIGYSIDHDFRTETNTHQPLQQTGSDTVRNRSSRAAAVCLVSLCVLLLTAVIVLCVHIHTKSTNYTEERDRHGWIYYKCHSYFMSSMKKNWTESRRYCTERGADLIIINNREEQGFVKNISGDAYVWIGLTDSDVEGTWKWVDGSTLSSGFWASGEPGGHVKENCALTHSSGRADYPCKANYQWICEKTIKTSH
ncbi:C-type lectin domain family 4 member M-like [Rhinichthys klamathensis goyatoka]|uniref:C-type lectin domain family 4 member M-like n=1 Tax=Rhinichthys klamathensis goyatoka TaxID=3034132 RepID=UPI0024B4A9F9|nr:C-type lectin domain family 4 member M-like [Rhinichthys klamathensis goyatoka]